jgi:hypothetical protein
MQASSRTGALSVPRWHIQAGGFLHGACRTASSAQPKPSRAPAGIEYLSCLTLSVPKKSRLKERLLLLKLPELDSNQQPSGYGFLQVSPKTGLSHRHTRLFGLRRRALSRVYWHRPASPFSLCTFLFTCKPVLCEQARLRITISTSVESGFPEFTRFFILMFPSGAATSA